MPARFTVVGSSRVSVVNDDETLAREGTGGNARKFGNSTFSRFLKRCESPDPPGLPSSRSTVEVTAAGHVRNLGLNMSTPAAGLPVFGRTVETEAEASEPPGHPSSRSAVEATAVGQVRGWGLNMSTPATRLPVLGRAVETEAVETQKQNERDGDHTKPKGKGWVERKGGKRQKTRELEAAAVKSTKAMLLNMVGENARAEKDWKAIRKSAQMALRHLRVGFNERGTDLRPSNPITQYVLRNGMPADRCQAPQRVGRSEMDTHQLWRGRH